MLKGQKMKLNQANAKLKEMEIELAKLQRIRQVFVNILHYTITADSTSCKHSIDLRPFLSETPIRNELESVLTSRIEVLHKEYTPLKEKLDAALENIEIDE